METAKLFLNGQSQAVRLPKSFRFKETEVNIKKIGQTVLLFPKGSLWSEFEDALNNFSDDFMPERNQTRLEKRESFFE